MRDSGRVALLRTDQAHLGSFRAVVPISEEASLPDYREDFFFFLLDSKRNDKNALVKSYEAFLRTLQILPILVNQILQNALLNISQIGKLKLLKIFCALTCFNKLRIDPKNFSRAIARDCHYW